MSTTRRLQNKGKCRQAAGPTTLPYSFRRKHYFYQDLPTGYQTLQHYGTASVDPSHISANSLVAPISLGGHLTLGNGVRRVGIKQIQLEQVRSSAPPLQPNRIAQVVQDTGKSTFDACLGKSYIDLNRAGTALLETVSNPDIKCV